LESFNLSTQFDALRTGTVRAPRTALRGSLRSSHLCVVLLSLILTVAFAEIASAQTADEFFHNGAQQYITNNVQGALLTVTNGLQQFPNDEKLKKLWKLLNQQQQQQQQQDQKDQEQQKQDQQQQGQEKDQKDQSQQSKDEQQKKEDEQKNQQAQNSKDQQKQDQKNQSGKPEKSDEQKQAEQAMQAHAMTAQEAKQLLDAQKDKEQVLIFKPQGEPKKAQQKPVKDW
jgi:type IV secretory pathway VirB10-like protein